MVGQEASVQVDRSEHLWSAAADVVRDQVGEAVWLTWFKAVQPAGMDAQNFTLTVTSRIHKERIETRYLALVRDALAQVGAADVDLEILVREVDPDDTDHDELRAEDEFAQNLPLEPDDVPHDVAGGAPEPGTSGIDEDRSVQINARYTFEAFVTGSSNRFAQAAALAVAETPAKSYNPLFIYGDAGLGKTHLLQAIAHYVRENYPTYVVRYVTTETFLNQYVDALRLGSDEMSEFKRRYRDVDVLLLDDIQFIEKGERTQEEFFHTFNHLHQANSQIVLSSDRAPDAMATLESRLRSRFKMGLITEVNPPDLETRLAILRKKSETEQPAPPPDVLEFIATHVTSNIRELEGALIRVSAYASLTKEPLTVELAERVLADIIHDNQPRPITLELILEATSEMFGIPIEEIRGKSRRRPLVTARQISMYVLRQLTDLSYPAIGKEFGGRDHTTVIYAVDKVTALMREKREVYDRVTELTQVARNGGVT